MDVKETEPLLTRKHSPQEEEEEEEEKREGKKKFHSSHNKHFGVASNWGVEKEDSFEEEEILLSLKKKERERRINWAALLVSEAVSASKSKADVGIDRSKDLRIWTYQLLHHPLGKTFFYSIVIVDMSLPFIEPSSHLDVRSTDNDYQPMLIEFFCMLVLCFQAYLQIYSFTLSKFLANPWRVAKVILIALTMAELIFWFPFVLSGHYSWRVTRLLRSFFLLEQGSRLRFISESIVRTVIQLHDILLFLLMYILFFTFIGYWLFHSYAPQEHYFDTFDNAFISLFILMTTANYPDVMLPYYRANAFASLFFIIYISLGIYLILNMVFASIYNHYRRITGDEIQRFVENREKLLLEAFYVLDGDKDGKIDFNTWQKLIKVCRPDLIPEQVAILFTMVDLEKRGIVTQEEFTEICDYLDLQFEKNTALSKRFSTVPGEGKKADYYDGFHSFAELSVNRDAQDHDALLEMLQRSDEVFGSSKRVEFPKLKREAFEQFAEKIVNNTFFSLYVGATIVIMTCMTISETYLPCNALNKDDNYCITLTICFTIIANLFLLELFLRIVAEGWFDFWLSWWNRIDTVVILLSWLGISAQLISIFVFDTEFGVHWLQLLCGARLVKILSLYKPFERIINTFIHLMPSMVPFLAVLLSIYYVWAIIGMELFFGKLYKGNIKLEGTTYDSLNYYCNNFDGFAHALVTLFELMVVNNWQVTMFGAVAATTKWSEIYFVMFYLVTVVVVLNLIVAFIVDAFVTKYETNARSDDWEEDVQNYFADAQALVVGYQKWNVLVPQRLLRLYLAMYKINTSPGEKKRLNRRFQEGNDESSFQSYNSENDLTDFSGGGTSSGGGTNRTNSGRDVAVGFDFDDNTSTRNSNEWDVRKHRRGRWRNRVASSKGGSSRTDRSERTQREKKKFFVDDETQMSDGDEELWDAADLESPPERIEGIEKKEREDSFDYSKSVGGKREGRSEKESFDGRRRPSIGGRRASIDGRRESIDGRRESIDGRRESIDGRRESIDGRRGGGRRGIKREASLRKDLSKKRENKERSLRDSGGSIKDRSELGGRAKQERKPSTELEEREKRERSFRESDGSIKDRSGLGGRPKQERKTSKELEERETHGERSLRESDGSIKDRSGRQRQEREESLDGEEWIMIDALQEEETIQFQNYLDFFDRYLDTALDDSGYGVKHQF